MQVPIHTCAHSVLPISQPLPWRASDLTTWGVQLWLVNHEDGDREDLEKDELVEAIALHAQQHAIKAEPNTSTTSAKKQKTAATASGIKTINRLEVHAPTPGAVAEPRARGRDAQVAKGLWTDEEDESLRNLVSEFSELGKNSRQRDCNFAGTPSSSLLKRLLKGGLAGGCSGMTVSPTARQEQGVGGDCQPDARAEREAVP